MTSQQDYVSRFLCKWADSFFYRKAEEKNEYTGKNESIRPVSDSEGTCREHEDCIPETGQIISGFYGGERYYQTRHARVQTKSDCRREKPGKRQSVHYSAQLLSEIRRHGQLLCQNCQISEKQVS